MTTVLAISSDRRCTALASQFALLALFLGVSLIVVFAQLDASLSSSDLPKHVLDEINAYTIFGHTLTLNPEHVTELLLRAWFLSLIFLLAFVELQPYGLRRWPRHLRRHPHAQRLFSSLCMRVSELLDYCLLIRRGFRFMQRHLYWRGQPMSHDSYKSKLKRFTNPAAPSNFGLKFQPK